ncbi:hypothetical protein [uncultured Paracoccus sp.]|uniref:hypothetical protein n=1 Tax=uncultured Paracoccus sp. TaxID=189685 RepID=UPI0025DB207C|nr:hypothetical protein [uncultured Paracoccus sp.]
MEKWRKDALVALDNAREEIMTAQGKTVMTIITVSEADLIGDQPVSFYGNIKFDFLGSFLAYCAERIAARRAAEGMEG